MCYRVALLRLDRLYDIDRPYIIETHSLEYQRQQLLVIIYKQSSQSDLAETSGNASSVDNLIRFRTR